MSTSGFVRYYKGPIVKDIDPEEHRKRTVTLNELMETKYQIKNGQTMTPHQFANKVLSAYGTHYKDRTDLEEMYMAFVSLLECTTIEWSTSRCLDS